MSQVESRTPSTDDNVTVLSRRTEIRGGTLSVAHDLTVRGVVEGEVRVGGRAVVAQGARLEGLLHAREAIIAGEVRGELTVAETLTLRSTAVVDGTATATRLVVEEGSAGSVSLRVGDREFFDGLEVRRTQAKADLNRVRARLQGPGSAATPDGPGPDRRTTDRISTDRLIESDSMEEFLTAGTGNREESDPSPADTTHALGEAP